MESVPESGGKLEGLSILVKGYGLPDIVHNNLAGITGLQVMAELLADLGTELAINVFIQRLEEVFAVHIQ
jgi:hypothetical protein